MTCCSIALNCCSIGLHAAEMTGSLCRHTAASKFHGEVAFSITLLGCEASRQEEVLKPRRKPLFSAQAPRKRQRIGVTARAAAIFLCCVQGPYEKKRRSWNGYLQRYDVFQTLYSIRNTTKIPFAVNRNETFVHILLAIETDDNCTESVRSPVGLSTMLAKATSPYFRPTILCKDRTNYLE